MKIAAVICLLMISQQGRGQALTKKFVNDWIVNCDSTIKPQLINLYVFDGVPYAPGDSVKLNSALKGLPFYELMNISYYRVEELNPYADLSPGTISVFLLRKTKQPAKFKKEMLKKAIASYSKPLICENHINTDSKDPVLTIDGKLIFHAACYDILNKIKTKDIYAISLDKHPVPLEFYGQNAKNGLVKILTFKGEATTHSPSP